MPQSVVEVAPCGAMQYEDFTLHNGGSRAVNVKVVRKIPDCASDGWNRQLGRGGVAQWARSTRKVDSYCKNVYRGTVLVFMHWIQLRSRKRRPIYRLTGIFFNALCWFNPRPNEGGEGWNCPATYSSPSMIPKLYSKLKQISAPYLS